ncbi:unnamed protein product [Parnassius apollo]|uniref:(apollo) hypothetical protein n=1 Tax=Parnassius apollo TaxID=110799 RepID=A0A8S3XEN6_PARAO|nr:unnamed protein product [Parnassius apollo]
MGVFLDIEKAFDRVWHTGLLYKLDVQTSIPPAILRLVASFLEGRKFYVCIEDAESAIKTITAGVPQGSCLSPALYAAYTNDIPTLAGHLHEWEDDVELALFADDSAYFTSSRRAHIAAARMQRLLDLLPPWLDEWRMAVNVSKTTALLTRRYRNLPPPLTLGGQEIAYEKAMTYLGCRIDRMLPAPAWYALLSDRQKQGLQAQQSLSLRTIVGAGRYVRNDVIAANLKMESLHEFVVRLARGMFDRADNGPHEHLNGFAPLHSQPPDGRPYPRELLPI